jgi:hypothetical protein
MGVYCTTRYVDFNTKEIAVHMEKTWLFVLGKVEIDAGQSQKWLNGQVA